MIARLEGTIISQENGTAILDVSGVGFAVYIPSNIDLPTGEKTQLYTYLHVRENELSLYGFPETAQRNLFELLLGVSGVGPKAALSLMSTFSVETLTQAIVDRQPVALSRAPGIGKKTAEAIVLHLKDKLTKISGGGERITTDDTDVLSALTALGFSIVEAQRALQKVPRGEALSVEEKIRYALGQLSQ